MSRPLIHLLPLLPLLAAGCPAPQPQPAPPPRAVGPVVSAQPARPKPVDPPPTPAPAPTPVAPAPVQESAALRLRLVSPKPGAERRFAPIQILVDVYHEESLDAVRINGQEAEWRWSRDHKPKVKKGAPEPAIELSRSRYQLRLRFPVAGKNPLTIEAEDQAGRVARREEFFQFRPPDGTPPRITLVTPSDGAVIDKGPVLVKVRAVDAVGKVARVTINGAEVKLRDDGTYQASMPRPQGGINRLRIDAWDSAGNQSTLRARFTFRPSDTAPPRIQLVEPDVERAVRESPVTIVVRVVDDDGGVDRVRINGKPAKLGDDGFYRYKLERPLVGLNPIRIVAWDPAGNRATFKTQFRFE